MLHQTISLFESLKEWHESKSIDTKNLQGSTDIVPVVFREYQGPYYLTFRDPQRGYTAKKRWYVDFIDNKLFQRLRTDSRSVGRYEDQWEEALNCGIREWILNNRDTLRVYREGGRTYLSLPRSKRSLETIDIEKILDYAGHWAYLTNL